MRWLAIDPATTMGLGLCRMDGADVAEVTTLRPAKARDLKGRAGMAPGVAITDGVVVWSSWAVAIQAFVRGAEHIVVEETFGESKATIAKLAHMRGRIEQECDRQGVAYTEVNVESWRKAIGGEVGLTYPPKRADIKARSLEIAARHYPAIKVANDSEAEALLIARWALMTWTVRP